MKLIEALDITQRCRRFESRFQVCLACSFTPLHLLTFLKAHLAVALPGRNVEAGVGLYGDLAGALQAASAALPDGVAVALEWPDLDPRLGVRSLGGWDPDQLPEMVEEARRKLARIHDVIAAIAAHAPVVVSLPTLPFPPAAFHPSSLQSPLETSLAEVLAQFASQIASGERVSLVNPRELDRVSPAAARHDVKAELASGFPYQMAHADALANLLAGLLAAPAPKKGLITDLDDTLWKGVVGDDGPEAVSWDMEHHAQMHGFYQQVVRSLARSGVLIGAASKNDPAAPERVFQRPDILLRPPDVFPVECCWDRKSISIGRILETWNIAADSVVFVDDNPMEIDEVRRSHPGIECILFPKDDPAAVYRLAYQLRDLFGKREIREEDRIRSRSLSAARSLQSAAAGEDIESFLRQAGSQLSLSWPAPPLDPRIPELINKTNQFNINGRRYGAAEWLEYTARPSTAVLMAEYADKYGPLGKIAALTGCAHGGAFQVDTWVMSCRAFSRRIEHHILKEIFDRWDISQVRVEFQPTERNGPCADFFTSLLGARPAGPFIVSRQRFEASCPPLYHQRAGAVPAGATGAN